MGKLKIKFHPLFVLYVFICIYFNWFNKIFFYVITVTFHEYGHYFCAKKYGYKIDSLVYSLNGAGITTKENFKEKDEIKIALAGPLVNVLFIILIMCLWWIFPTLYLFTYDFFVCNIVVFLFNMLPLYPLDGGRIIVSILVLKGKSKKKLLRLEKIVGMAFSIIFLILFILSLIYRVNFNLLIISCFLMTNSLTIENNKYFDKVQAFNKSYSRPIEIKKFRVSNLEKSTLIKYLSPQYFSVFECVCDGKVITISEDDLY